MSRTWTESRAPERIWISSARSPEGLRRWQMWGYHHSESWTSCSTLANRSWVLRPEPSLIERASSKRGIAVSVDLFGGEVLARDPSLKIPPLDLICELNPFPIREIILLSLDRVGTSMGLDEVFLRKAADLSDHPVLLGGGVKDESDLDRLEDLGLAGALVATAVHDGKISPDAVRR